MVLFWDSSSRWKVQFWVGQNTAGSYVIHYKHIRCRVEISAVLLQAECWNQAHLRFPGVPWLQTWTWLDFTVCECFCVGVVQTQKQRRHFHVLHPQHDLQDGSQVFVCDSPAVVLLVHLQNHTHTHTVSAAPHSFSPHQVRRRRWPPWRPTWGSPWTQTVDERWTERPRSAWCRSVRLPAVKSKFFTLISRVAAWWICFTLYTTNQKSGHSYINLIDFVIVQQLLTLQKLAKGIQTIYIATWNNKCKVSPTCLIFLII